MMCFAIAFCAALAFALYTQHAWEDWYITYRSSRNLALGKGLVYNIGERVHTFTSVLGTLIPAALSYLTFNRSDDLVLWLFRILNCSALGVAATLLWRAACRAELNRWSAVMLIGLFAFDAKTIDFAINGMETAYVVLALSLFIYFVTTQPLEKLAWRLGAVWAFLEYARPDGLIFAGLLSVALILFAEDKRVAWSVAIKAALIGALLFLPWCIIALVYYGSPVPHSIVAKGALMGYHLSDLSGRLVSMAKAYALLRPSVFDDIFAPPYSGFFNLPAVVWLSRALATLAAVVWLWPRVHRMGRITSFAFAGFTVYLALFVPFIYPWYVPGATLLAAISLAFFIHALTRAASTRPAGANAIGATASVATVIFTIACTAITAEQFRGIERINERDNRELIGRWLKAHAQSRDDTVFVECAGYIGFYSGLKLYDFPGMTSPEMVQARRLLGTDDWLSLIKYLEPDWLVLRPGELARLVSQERDFLPQNYIQAADFNVTDKVEAVRFRPYDDYWRMDARFLIFQRKKT